MVTHNVINTHINTFTNKTNQNSLFSYLSANSESSLLFSIMEETKSKFKRICVYCGSSSGNKPTYQEAAVELGKELVYK